MLPNERKLKDLIRLSTLKKEIIGIQLTRLLKLDN